MEIEKKFKLSELRNDMIELNSFVDAKLAELKDKYDNKVKFIMLDGGYQISVNADSISFLSE